MIKLVASDLDGTLLFKGAQSLPEEIFPLIRQLKKMGILFVAASGRQYANMKKMFRPVVDDMPGVTDKLEEKMCKAWVNFAKTGMPFIDETIAWPACTEETENYMVIDNDKWQVREKFDYELVKQVADSGMKSPFSIKERRKMLQKTQKEAEEKGVFLH